MDLLAILKLLALSVLLCGKSTKGASNEADYPDKERVLVRGDDGVLKVELSISAVDVDSETFTTQLIGYNGKMGGPTLRLQPGDVLEIELQNDLPEELCSTSGLPTSDMIVLWNNYHAPYTTNLHTHGSHVRSSENPVVEEVQPGETHTYVINYPDNHMGATAWYHPHIHGSSTLQAGGGASGFLIVEDMPGDIPEEIRTLPEILLKFHYINTGALFQYNIIADGYRPSCQAVYPPDEFPDCCTNEFFSNFPLPPVTLFVNGLEQPTITIAAGQWYRMRTLWVPTGQTGVEFHIPDCDFKLLSKDGLYMPVSPRDIEAAFLTSGSRADFLIRCPEVAVDYPLLTLKRTAGFPPTLAADTVLATFQTVEPVDPITVDDIEPFTFRAGRPCYIADLLDVEADTESYVAMGNERTDEDLAACLPETRNNVNLFGFNNEGTLSSDFINEGDGQYAFDLEAGQIFDIDFCGTYLHPIHMHMNPFQIVELPEALEIYNDYFQPGDFHDNIMLPRSPDGDVVAFMKMRMHVDSYVGRMYMHCHFYIHSDLGMAAFANIGGEEGATSEKLSSSQCYRVGEDRIGFSLLSGSEPTPPSQSECRGVRCKDKKCPARLASRIGLKVKPNPNRNKTIRFASYSVEMSRSNAGDLTAELSTPDSEQAQAVAVVIQINSPDVLLLTGFDYDEDGEALANFQTNYLEVSQNGQDPISYEFSFMAPTNSGVDSGFDLNNDGEVGGEADTFGGFGSFPGQSGMVVLSRYPIDTNNIRTFQNFLWSDMPCALLPEDRSTGEPFYAEGDESDNFRLSSTSHWDVPLITGTNDEIVHLLASNPTSPSLDDGDYCSEGSVDWAGLRNHDEIRFWADYVNPEESSYIYDDSGNTGGLEEDATFIIAGDLSADPFDGVSVNKVVRRFFFRNRLINQGAIPSSVGAVEAAESQGGANADQCGMASFDTVDMEDEVSGNLRVDYVLPSTSLKIRNARVFWPVAEEEFASVVATASSHRMVFLDVKPNDFLFNRDI